VRQQSRLRHEPAEPARSPRRTRFSTPARLTVCLHLRSVLRSPPSDRPSPQQYALGHGGCFRHQRRPASPRVCHAAYHDISLRSQSRHRRSMASDSEPLFCFALGWVELSRIGRKTGPELVRGYPCGPECTPHNERYLRLTLRFEIVNYGLEQQLHSGSG
jgi:hypothetical protein